MSDQKLYRGSLQTIVLNLLKTQNKMYGYEITQKVKEITNGELLITEGALYPTLHKLESNGFLSVEVKNVGNRKRKYYFLTEEGINEHDNKLSELESYISTMQTIINSKLKLT